MCSVWACTAVIKNEKQKKMLIFNKNVFIRIYTGFELDLSWILLQVLSFCNSLFHNSSGNFPNYTVLAAMVQNCAAVL
jgi:hypothetical protein